MSAFAVISQAPNPALGLQVQASYPGENIQFSPTSWFVADTNKTTQEVCQKLNIGEGGHSEVAVFKVDAYFGYAQQTLWEWLRVKGTGV